MQSGPFGCIEFHGIIIPGIKRIFFLRELIIGSPWGQGPMFWTLLMKECYSNSLDNGPILGLIGLSRVEHGPVLHCSRWDMPKRPIVKACETWGTSRVEWGLNFTDSYFFFRSSTSCSLNVFVHVMSRFSRNKDSKLLKEFLPFLFTLGPRCFEISRGL